MSYTPGNRKNSSNSNYNVNAEIVSLLNQVAKRLSRNEQERKTLLQLVRKQNDSLLNLKDKSGKSEQIQMALIKRQEKIEREQKANEGRLDKAATLADKLEETISQQNRLFRRMEKITTDRARMVRKLERIEEVVMETNDAINAKAMVLLTDKNVAGKTDLPQMSAKRELESIDVNKPSNENHSLWRTPQRLQAAIVVVLLLLISFSGWGVRHIDKLMSAPSHTFKTATTKQLHAPVELYSTSTDATVFAERLAVPVTSTPQEIPARIETPANMETPVRKATPVTYSDEDSLLAKMLKDPNALAKELNRLAPATQPVPRAPAPVVKKTSYRETSRNAAEETTIFEEDIEDFVAPSRSIKSVVKKPAVKKSVTKKAPENKLVAKKSTKSLVTPPDNSLAKRIKADPDLPKVVKEIEKKAFEGNPEAQHDIAAIYTAGHGGATINFTRAAMWFEEAAHQGVANARYNLGVLYHQGLGVNQDTDKAIEWYNAASELNHPEAQYNLGIAHIEGIGTNYNPLLASNFFRQAANSGIMEAAYNLGLIYENGLTGETRPQEALSWYKAAAEQGSPEARTALEQLANTLNISLDKIKSPLVKKLQRPIAATETSNNASAPVETIKSVAGLSMADMEEPHSGSAGTNPTFDSKAAIVAQIQEQLVRVGLYPGPADGINGNLTGDAIRSYQRDNDLTVDGITTETLLVHMLSSEMEGTIRPIVSAENDMLPPGEFGSREE